MLTICVKRWREEYELLSHLTREVPTFIYTVLGKIDFDHVFVNYLLYIICFFDTGPLWIPAFELKGFPV